MLKVVQKGSKAPFQFCDLYNVEKTHNIEKDSELFLKDFYENRDKITFKQKI